MPFTPYDINTAILASMEKRYAKLTKKGLSHQKAHSRVTRELSETIYDGLKNAVLDEDKMSETRLDDND